MIDDNRAQSLGLVAFILALIGGAFLIWILRMAGQPILNHARNATAHSGANTATGWFETFMTFLPAIFLLIGMFGTIVLAIYQREAR